MTELPDDLVQFAVTLADEAESLLRAGTEAAASARLKADRSFVTDLDNAIEQRLRASIADRYPAHGVIGEEGEDVRADAEWTWVLDPIDGTAPFIAGMPVYGSLIALCRHGEPKVGVITFPATQDRWVGVAGRPTQRNGAPCRTRAGEGLPGAIQAVMNPDFFDDGERKALQAVCARTAWRIYGGSAFSYGLLASGRIDLAIDTRLKVHDYAAFVPVIEGAGGVITDWDGARLRVGSGPRVLAAGDPSRHAEALRLVRDALA